MLRAVCGKLLTELKDIQAILQFINHMATVSAYRCCSALQYLKEAAGMNQILSPNFFFAGIKQVVSLGHVSLAIKYITLEPPI
jgi:hypothetical protein